MIDIRELCQTSHQISKAAGWQDGPKRSNADTINLFVSEISEALEDYRNNRRLDEVYYEVKFEAYGDLAGSIKGTSIVTPEELAKLKENKELTLLSAKPCGIPIELADLVIRICQHCGTEGVAEELYKWYEAVKIPEDAPEIAGFDRLLFILTRCAVQSLRSFEKSGRLGLDSLADALNYVFTFCQVHKIDIESAIKEKEAYNKTRAYRHGGKRI